MKYRKTKNDELSILGFGCMRFNKDKKEVEREVMHAINSGINYFDTAYMYHKSEEILGQVLYQNNVRDKVRIATKVPPFLIKNIDKLDKIFDEQLNRLKTDYIDYYLIHMLTEENIWDNLVQKGIVNWIEEKKKQGKIKNIGFSYHGGKEDFIKIIDSFSWDFCMIQYNYMDENHQAGKAGLQYAYKKNIPVFVMEPLRGGNLVNKLPKEIIKIFKEKDKKRSSANWAFRWIWNHEEVTTVLSGMNSMDMLQENIEIASSSNISELSEEELEMFREIKQILKKKVKVPCTSCNYCISSCPVNVDIPTCFNCYNNIEIDGFINSLREYIMQTKMKKISSNASICINCKRCEKHCPQNIDISNELKSVSKKMEGFSYKVINFILKRIIKY